MAANALCGLPEGSTPTFLFVFENHSGIRGFRHVGWSLATSLGRWFEWLDLIQHPRHLRIGVQPKEWQLAVLGCAWKERSAERKAQALRWASNHVRAQISSEDEADAIAISRWGTIDGVRAIERRKWEGAVKQRIKRERRRRA